MGRKPRATGKDLVFCACVVAVISLLYRGEADEPSKAVQRTIGVGTFLGLWHIYVSYVVPLRAVDNRQLCPRAAHMSACGNSEHRVSSFKVLDAATRDDLA